MNFQYEKLKKKKKSRVVEVDKDQLKRYKLSIYHLNALHQDFLSGLKNRKCRLLINFITNKITKITYDKLY